MNKRELIMDEAFKLFFEKGFYGLSIQDLVDRCDIPKGSFYYYFPDGKNQLLIEVIERTYNRMKDAILARFLVKETAVDAFVSMVNHHISTIEGRKYTASLMMTMVAIESLHLNERAHEVCKNVYVQWQNLYYEKLLEYGYEPQLARQKAQALFALVHGSMISSFIKQSNVDLLLIKEEIKNILE